MFTCARGKDVSFKDVKIKIPDRTWGCEWRHAPETCAEDFGRFEKSWVEFCLGRRRLTFAYSPWPCVGCASGLGEMVKFGVSLSLCRKTFKLKGNKKFRTWTKKSSSVFRVSWFLCSINTWVMNVLHTGMNMSISRIHIWICYNASLTLHMMSDGVFRRSVLFRLNPFTFQWTGFDWLICRIEYCCWLLVQKCRIFRS